MIYVVGSGPAGVACARALLDGGREVTLLDAGLEVEANRAEVIDRLGSSGPEGWRVEDVASIRDHVEARTDGVPKKLCYGSDFPYREAESDLNVRRTDVDCVPSFARGGFSNVWGGSVLPFRQAEILDWPIRADDLAPHYRAVLSWMPFSATQDDLAELLPLYSDSPRSIPSSRQAERLLGRLASHRSELKNSGIIYGRSRVAVDQACFLCGLCLYGCPHKLIYNSSSTLQDLCDHPGFRYQRDVVVDRLEETNDGVTILGRSRADGSRLSFRGSRVFLACGAIATTRILLESLTAYDQTVTLCDSQYYIFPMLQFERTKNVQQEQLHTMVQVLLEILDPSISEHLISLQLYSYNDLYEKSLRGMFGMAYPLLQPSLNMLISRLWVVQGYLHSTISPTISARLERGKEGETSILHLERSECEAAAKAIRQVIKKLFRHRSHLGMIPLSPMLKQGNPGRGFHHGGSFPMRANPARFETDVVGRPHGFERVHAVDSTVFPSIPATTITLTSMANAHRIGVASLEL